MRVTSAGGCRSRVEQRRRPRTGGYRGLTAVDHPPISGTGEHPYPARYRSTTPPGGSPSPCEGSAATAAPLIAPTDVPRTSPGRAPAASSALSMPTSYAPSAPPPAQHERGAAHVTRTAVHAPRVPRRRGPNHGGRRECAGVGAEGRPLPLLLSAPARRRRLSGVPPRGHDRARRRGPGACGELAVGAGEGGLGSLDADGQVGGDLAVACALGDQRGGAVSVGVRASRPAGEAGAGARDVEPVEGRGGDGQPGAGAGAGEGAGRPR